MNIARVAALCISVSVLVACGNNDYLPYPRAAMFPGTEQQSLQSASHWQLLAQNESKLIRSSLGDGGGVIPSTLYLGRAPDNAGDFQSAYHNMLEASLVDQGVGVMLSRENALFTLDYDVQVIEHENREWLPARPGLITAFMLTGVGIHDSQYWGDRGLILIPVALAGDLWNKFNKDRSASVTEVIISTRVMDSQQIVHSNSRVYYFDEDDIAQYRGQGRVFNVVSSRGDE